MPALAFTTLITVAAASCLAATFLIWFISRLPSTLMQREDAGAVQAAHTRPTARVGGLAIMVALAAGALMHNTPSSDHIFVLTLASALPVFIVGLGEDVGLFASPRRRLLAAAASGVLFILLIGQWLAATDIPGLDYALQWTPAALLFSIILAAGVSHAFNLIDGLNGLAGLTALGAALALAAVAHAAELPGHRDALLIMSAAVVGFLILNFPFGKIFLGDAGAYTLGHMLVWIAISILWSAPAVSPLAVLLIFFWPIADTLLAIARRLRLGKSITQPDRLHFHQFVMRAVEIVLLGRRRRRIANPLATLLTLPFIGAPMAAGVLLQLDRGGAAVAIVAFACLFVATYRIGMWVAPRLRRTPDATRGTEPKRRTKADFPAQ